MRDTRTYIRLDDHLSENPKIVKAGERAELLYVRGLQYCGRQLTDGRIPKDFAHRLLNKGGETEAARLCKEGLWVDHGDDYAVHDYLEHQRSRAEVEEQRRKSRDRQRKHRAQSRVTDEEVQEPEAEAEATTPPTPAKRGLRENGINPRAQGTNPRAIARTIEIEGIRQKISDCESDGCDHDPDNWSRLCTTCSQRQRRIGELVNA